MSSSEARSRHRNRRTATIERFCAKYEMNMESLNSGYQLRVEGVADFYPTNGRYHILQTSERGSWDNMDDLRQVMLNALPHPKHLDMYDKPADNPFGEPVPVDEWDLSPIPKLRPPQKSWWRRIFKAIWRPKK